MRVKNLRTVRKQNITIWEFGNFFKSKFDEFGPTCHEKSFLDVDCF
jgi:hypothetical protein